MSNTEACPDNSSVCADPLPLSCSFKGCNPLQLHDQSYQVSVIGEGDKPSLREATTHLFCGVEPSLSIIVDNAEFIAQPCSNASWGYKFTNIQRTHGFKKAEDSCLPEVVPIIKRSKPDATTVLENFNSS